MKVAVLLNGLGLGGTEKAAVLWAIRLKKSGQDIRVIALEDGPRRAAFEEVGLPVTVVSTDDGDCAARLAGELRDVSVIHAHAPGFAHKGDILGTALKISGRTIPVVQTNIFGKLENPAEDEWTDFHLFISWTSCVQAARRSGKKLDLAFFRRKSVAVYPVEDPFDATPKEALCNKAEAFRQELGLTRENMLFGRFSRPEPNKWTPLVLQAFMHAHRQNPKLRLLLREPPVLVARELCDFRQAIWYGEAKPTNEVPIILISATADQEHLSLTQIACDVVLHTSSIGESFGYGIAEPMALGKPVITNSVPWHDQAQIELVRHGETGLIASTVSSMESAINRAAVSSEWRSECGEFARQHILSVADPEISTKRLETAIQCVIDGCDNPFIDEDMELAHRTADYLDKHQWGHSLEESLQLRTGDAKVRLRKWQRQLRNRLSLNFPNRGDTSS